MSLESDLLKKIHRNSLEVEDLLAVAKKGTPADAAVIKNLAQTHHWYWENHVAGTQIVPLARWAHVVCEFLVGSYPAVLKLANESDEGVKNTPLVLGLLEELHSREAVDTVLRIMRDLQKNSTASKELTTQCVSTLNSLLSFKPWIQISEEQSAFVRDFLHARLSLPLSDTELAITLCAFRGVGDESSVALIESARELSGPWAGTEATAIRAIKNRLSGKR